MRKLLIIACVALQVSVLLYMVLKRENIISNGTTITLLTAPIDPRDPFRGDFVRLRYDMNSLSNAPNDWNENENPVKKGDVLYAVLAKQNHGVFALERFTKNPDQELANDELLLRGRSNSQPHWRTFGGHDIKFGLEQMFVEQDKGFDIEERQGLRGGFQNALLVTAAVGKDGTAVLTDYHWNDLAILVEAESSPENTNNTNTVENTPKTTLLVRVKNLADHAVILNNPETNCGFQIEVETPDSMQVNSRAGCGEPDNTNPVSLAPGDELSFSINLSEPRWYVGEPGLKPEFIYAYQFDAEYTHQIDTESENFEYLPKPEFRVVYRSSTQPESTKNSSNESVQFWQGNLSSQLINPQIMLNW